MPVVITGFYAGLAALLFVGLSARVIRARIRGRIGLGDGGDAHMRQVVRSHANFAEYVPLALLLMALLELGGAPAVALHGLGIALLAGRILHTWGLARSSEQSLGRTLGMVLTFAVLVIAALWAIGSYLG